MIKLIILFEVILLSFQSQASNKISKDDIRKELGNMFSVGTYEYQGTKYAYRMVDTLESDHFLFSFVNDNNLMLDYLLQNQLTISNDSLHTLAVDEVRLKKYFNESLYLDKDFTNNVVSLADNYLHKDDKENPVRRKDSVKISDIAQLAVRFFYPMIITDNDEVKTKICVGIHGLKDYGAAREYIKEAFAFQVIFGQLKADNSEIYDEYNKILEDTELMNLSSDKDTRLKRIQGAVWTILSKNEILRKTIKQEYEKMKSYLSFYIK